jgi:hypothetical protein
MRRLFQRGDGRILHVDADLWLCALDLAAVHGWKPHGTMPPVGSASELEDRLAYHRTDGRRLLREDASALATSLEAGLRHVRDSEVPLHGKSFGEEHTLALLSRAAAGETLDAEMGDAAAELLSGPPKSEAWVLVDFLRGGEVSIGAVQR